MSQRKKSSTSFLLQGSILAVASLLSRVIGMFYRLPVTNIIGDVGNDYYSCAFEIYNIFLLISSFSLPLAVSKLVSARISRGEKTNAFRIVKGAFVFAAVSGSVAALIVYFGAEYITNLLKTPMAVYALRILSPTLVIVAILGVLRGYFQGLGSMVPSAISQVIEQIINALVSMGAAYYLFGYGKKVGEALGSPDKYAAAYGAAGSTLGTCAGAAAGFLFLLFVFFAYRTAIKRRKVRERNVETESYGQVAKIILFTILPVLLSTTIYNISGILDQGIFKNLVLLKGYSKDEEEILWGVFSGKYKLLINVPISIASALSASCVPNLAASYANRRMDVVRQQISAAMRFNMIIVFPCTVGIGVLASPIMQLLLKDSSELTERMLQVGAVAVLFFSISTLSNGILQGINRMRQPVVNAAIALGLHLIILVLFLWVFDLNIYAVVYANTLFALFMCIFNGICIRKYSGYVMDVVHIFVLPGLASLIMGIFVYFSYRGLYHATGSNTISTLLSVFVGVVVYGICMLKGGLTEEEILKFPKGAAIVRMAKKLHLLKEHDYI
ncbi:MAG: polysaccharide biosynthesis protein [Roseburia sp.]|nr:polysaccharide biosynthesis protein [Roseburia sp.]